MNPGALTDIAAGTAAFVGLLGVAVIVAIFAERVRVPAAVAFVAVGLIFPPFKPVAIPFTFGATLLFVYLPPLIFEAAWNLEFASLRRMGVAIAVLALPGVLVSTLIVAFGVTASGQLPVIAAFMLGAIVSATDPVAVISIFRRMNVPVDLQTLIEGESISNDGVAIALYGVALALAAGPATVNFGFATWHALLSIAGGIAIGLVTAVVSGFAIRSARDRATEIAATIVLAYAAYGLANYLDLSGVFATAAAAVLLRVYCNRIVTAQSTDDVDRFWEVIAFVANALVFLSTGLVIQANRIVHEPVLVIVAVLAVFGARAILAFGVLPLLRIASNKPTWRTTTFFAGMRGALALGLALGLPDGFPNRPQIIDATFAIVFVTLVVQGAALEPVIARLNRRAQARLRGES